MARESSLWTWLAKARLAFGESLHMERVENLLCAGTPDVEGFLRLPTHHFDFPEYPTSGAFQLELKSSERPARSHTPIRFKLRGREAQIEFMRRRWALGANAFFLLQVGSGSERRLYLAPGDLGAKLLAGLHEAALSVECCNTGVFPARVSQAEILKRIVQCRAFPSLSHS